MHENFWMMLDLISRAFMFPNELHLELDYWAETGEFDEEELHEMKVDGRVLDPDRTQKSFWA